MSLAAVILAAGEGKRLQTLGPKAFLKLNDGITFIENIYLNIFHYKNIVYHVSMYHLIVD